MEGENNFLSGIRAKVKHKLLSPGFELSLSGSFPKTIAITCRDSDILVYSIFIFKLIKFLMKSEGIRKRKTVWKIRLKYLVRDLASSKSK